MNSKITLTFEEYQLVRDAMAFARGNLQCYRRGDTPAYPDGLSRLEGAQEVLEAARWRTEDEGES